MPSRPGYTRGALSSVQPRLPVVTAPDDLPPVPPHRAGGGVFVTDGARLAIGPVRIEVADGKVVNSSIPVRVGLNVCPVWAGIAVEHLLRGRACREAVLAAWRGTDDNVLGSALIDESTACMQAIAAAATTVDALYAGVKEHIVLPEATLTAWRQKRTARHKQVVEVLRQAFRVQPGLVVSMQERLEEVYRYRGWALHPPAEAQETARHRLLRLQTEWRFVAFSYPNAFQLVRRSLSLCWDTASQQSVPHPGLQEYCSGLKRLLTPVIARWEDAIGPLAQQGPNPPGVTA